MAALGCSTNIMLSYFLRLGLGTKKMEEIINEEAQILLKLLETKQNQPLTLNVSSILIV